MDSSKNQGRNRGQFTKGSAAAREAGRKGGKASRGGGRRPRQQQDAMQQQ